MTYHLGIDLGTTYTAAAIHRDGQVEMVSLGTQSLSIPSVLFLKDDGAVLTGQAAYRRGLVDPARSSAQFKRRLGDGTSIVLGGTPFSAEALMAKLLRWTVDTVSELHGGPPESVALTHPANWGAYKLERFDQAIQMADLSGAVTLTEPEAAAIHYASNERVDPASVIAVYDLGGGTFDVAVLRKDDDGWDVLGVPQGIEQLGGVDIDEAVFEHVRQSIPDVVEQLNVAGGGAGARLLRDCVEAKEALSSDTDVTIAVVLPSVETQVRLTRSELEAMIAPTLTNTVGAMQRAMASAEVTPDDVSAVLLVGGSSRIPMIGDLVSNAFGRPIAVDAHPKHAVALGAAIAAAAHSSPSPATETPIAVVHRTETEPDAPPSPSPEAPAADLAPPAPVDTVETPAEPEVAAAVAAGPSAAVIEPPIPNADGDAGAGAPPSHPPERGVAVEPETPAADGESTGTGNRSRWNLLVPVAVVGAVVVALLVFVTRGDATPTVDVVGSPGSPLLVDGLLWVPTDDGLTVVVDPETERVLTTVATDTIAFPRGKPTAADGLIWIPTSDETVQVVNTATREVIDDVDLRSPGDPDLEIAPELRIDPGAPLFAAGLIWVPVEISADDGSGTGQVEFVDGKIAIIDPSSREILDLIDVGLVPLQPLADGDLLWVPNANNEDVSVIDMTTRTVIGTVRIGASPGTPLAAGGRVWMPVEVLAVGDEQDRPGFAIIDPSDPDCTGADEGDEDIECTFDVEATIAVDLRRDTPPAVIDDEIWVPTFSGVTVIDPETLEQRDLEVDGRAAGSAVLANDLVWIAQGNPAGSDRSGTVVAIDPDSLDIVHTFTVGRNPTTPVEAGGRLFVPNTGDETLSIIDFDDL